MERTGNRRRTGWLVINVLTSTSTRQLYFLLHFFVLLLLLLLPFQISLLPFLSPPSLLFCTRLFFPFLFLPSCTLPGLALPYPTKLPLLLSPFLPSTPFLLCLQLTHSHTHTHSPSYLPLPPLIPLPSSSPSSPPHSLTHYTPPPSHPQPPPLTHTHKHTQDIDNLKCDNKQCGDPAGSRTRTLIPSVEDMTRVSYTLKTILVAGTCFQTPPKGSTGGYIGRYTHTACLYSQICECLYRQMYTYTCLPVCVYMYIYT